jgi:hypothetical protein
LRCLILQYCSCTTSDSFTSSCSDADSKVIPVSLLQTRRVSLLGLNASMRIRKTLEAPAYSMLLFKAPHLTRIVDATDRIGSQLGLSRSAVRYTLVDQASQDVLADLTAACKRKFLDSLAFLNPEHMNWRLVSTQAKLHPLP